MKKANGRGRSPGAGRTPRRSVVERARGRGLGAARVARRVPVPAPRVLFGGSVSGAFSLFSYRLPYVPASAILFIRILQ